MSIRDSAEGRRRRSLYKITTWTVDGPNNRPAT